MKLKGWLHCPLGEQARAVYPHKPGGGRGGAAAAGGGGGAEAPDPTGYHSRIEAGGEHHHWPWNVLHQPARY